MNEDNKTLTFSVIVAILLVYMILASLYESFKLPFVIMTTIPLALIGVIITLFITQFSMNISVYIGLIILAGIVVNNGIILVHEINRSYNFGMLSEDNLKENIIKICLKRFRPVLITTITTICGLTPMLLKSGDGSNLWRPLSLTVISGLFFSTALTLIVVQVISSIVYKNIIKS